MTPAAPTTRLGVVGDPIAHSLSPVMHRAAYAELGLAEFSYTHQQVTAGGLAAFVADLDASWRGLSVTMPLKREALRLASRVTDAAEVAGGANTLILEGGSAVLADNTDVGGGVAALVERGVDTLEVGAVVGGGATAASMALALVRLGARRLTFVVRNAQRAAATLDAVRALPDAPELTVIATEDPSTQVEVPQPEVVVSTVPVGGQTDQVLDLLDGARAAFDVVYDPWPTPFAARAEEQGAVLIDGLDLLAHQAAAQVTLFTGGEVPVELLRTAAALALAERH